MNSFYEHHRDSIHWHYRCFDRILLNGLIQPFQQPERVVGFFNTYRQLYPVTPRTNTPILAGDAIPRHSSPDWRSYEVAVRVASGIARPTTYTVDAGDRTGGDGQGRLSWRSLTIS